MPSTPPLSQSQAADYARCSVATIYRARASGNLAHEVIVPEGHTKGRVMIKTADLDAWILSGKPTK